MDEQAQQTLSVSQALDLARGALNRINISIVGEISELSDKAGYKAVYFTICDKSSALSCLMWRNIYALANIDIKCGMLVEVTGVFSVYPAKGRMNFDVKSIKIAGEGDLRVKVSALAKKLAALGLMDPQRKRILPRFPSAIAVVTSPRGKAIHDVLRTLRRRFAPVEVLVCGVAVEGQNAALNIIKGLQCAQESNAEIILLVRGGGSYEDLMPFNDEALAYAIANSTVPVITGIGHEPDNSIADMVADFRASTPTAAAEHVVPHTRELSAAFNQIAGSISRTLLRSFTTEQEKIDRFADRPVMHDPMQFLLSEIQVLQSVNLRMNQALTAKLQGAKQQVNTNKNSINTCGVHILDKYKQVVGLNAAKLDSLSPLHVLSRGYTITFDEQDHVLNSVEKIDVGNKLNIRFIDGMIAAHVVGKHLDAGNNIDGVHN